MMRLVESADLTPADLVVEIGSGTGSLTALVAPRVARVLALEIDSRLARAALPVLRSFPNVELLVTDVLARKSQLAPRLVEALRVHLHSGLRLKLVANLPYQIATPLVVDFLLGPFPVQRLCFTVQREVGARFLAATGDAAYSIISILTSLWCKARRIARVPPQAFWPQPKVESVMLLVDPRSTESVADRQQFAAFVRGFFQMRRKTLARAATTLRIGESFAAACRAIALQPTLRPDQVDPPSWLALWRSFKQASSPVPG